MPMTFMGRRVKQVYWGKPGCGCGCNGTYSQPDAEMADLCDKERGYPSRHVSPRACKNVLKHFDFVGPPQATPVDGGYCFFNENAETAYGSRRYAWVYTA